MGSAFDRKPFDIGRFDADGCTPRDDRNIGFMQAEKQWPGQHFNAETSENYMFIDTCIVNNLSIADIIV